MGTHKPPYAELKCSIEYEQSESSCKEEFNRGKVKGLLEESIKD